MIWYLMMYHAESYDKARLVVTPRQECMLLHVDCGLSLTKRGGVLFWSDGGVLFFSGCSCEPIGQIRLDLADQVDVGGLDFEDDVDCDAAMMIVAHQQVVVLVVGQVWRIQH